MCKWTHTVQTRVPGATTYFTQPACEDSEGFLEGREGKRSEGARSHGGDRNVLNPLGAVIMWAYVIVKTHQTDL